MTGRVWIGFGSWFDLDMQLCRHFVKQRNRRVLVNPIDDQATDLAEVDLRVSGLALTEEEIS